MSEEYKLLAHLPFEDPEAEAIQRIADDIGQPISLGPEGAPEVNTTELLIYGFEPDDVDQDAVTDLFGLGINLTLVFTDPEVSDRLGTSPVAEHMMKAAVLLAGVEGAKGVLVTEYTADGIILRFENGQVTLNQDWPGWQDRPEVLTTVPEPRVLSSLRGRD